MYKKIKKAKDIVQKNRGVTIFFAVLIIGILLSVGTSISLLTQKEISLSSLGKQSELAFYAADSGIECVEYWDKNQSPNPFDPNSGQPQSVIGCNVAGNNGNITVCDNTSSTLDPCNGPTRTFTIKFGTACALINIQKVPVNGVTVTSITSHGYNDCTGASAQKLERAIQLTY